MTRAGLVYGALMTCAAVLGCGDDAEDSVLDASSGDGDGDTSDAATDSGSGASSDAFGTFSIELVANEDGESGMTSIVGRAYETEPLANVLWMPAEEEGDCQLFEPLIPFCDPSCGSGTTCSPAGSCVTPPAALDLGTVSFEGLRTEDGEAEIALEPLPPSNTYQPRSTSDLAFPPFSEGDAITLSAGGGDIPAFELSASGIAPLEVLSPSPTPFDPDAETILRWRAPADSQRSRVIITVDISHHGGRKGELVCTTADDGEHELPAELVQGLIDLGVAGFPTVTLTRESTSDSVATPGLTLRLFSEVDLTLEIPGVISCEESGQQDVCPDGQTCQANKICR